MGAVEVLPDGEPPVRAETLHESERTRVTRLFLAGRTVIRKQPLGSDAVRRLEHERAMLERLRGLDGVAQVVDAPPYPDSIVLADVGGTSTAALVKPLAVDDLIGLALALARAVAGMHRRGVMHRDITPANVVLSDRSVPCLVDFALATSVAEMRPEFTPHSEMVGTLAYLAPEQTGRTGRPVDQRADLYALGATLYQLATGGPPFGTGDPLRLTHDHLARVPVAPMQRNPDIPAPLSEIILHLLEKEPDHRYHTADGLVYDLQRLQDGHARSGAAPFRIGEGDLPPRLLPPSRLVGREDEVATLRVAFEQALMGRCRGLLVSGAPGVGKTALCNELRPVVTGGDGWFVAGKFDQYRRHLEFDGVYQAFRALGRLLLAEPEDDLVGVRERILRALGPNAGLTTAIVPEFATLLAVPPDPGDPLTAQVRAQRNAREILRAVASRKRPLVFFVDDLQWAGRTPLGLFDLALTEEPIEGLLIVGAYREGDVNAAQPLAALLSRWREAAGVREMRLANLSVSGFVAMVAEMLHVDQAEAVELTEVIAPHTGGNPYDTVELLNALRRDGLLATTAVGSQWDVAVLRAHLGASEVAGLTAGRVEALPTKSRAAVEAMACLGGWAELGLLQAATGEPANLVERALAPALEEGLLVAEPGAHQAVRFRHDRLREATLSGLDPRRRGALQLAMARRLAGVPELFAAAAEQYLPVAGAVDDAAERRVVVALLRCAADQAALIGDYALMDALLAAAPGLISPDETATLLAVHTGRHAALYGLGRLEEADEAFGTITALCASATERAGATAVQVRSLTYRSLFADAIALSVESLCELGIAVPAAERRSAELDRQFGHLYRWLDHTDTADELARPEITDPALLAATHLINAALPACYVSDHPALAWLSLEALRIWIEHGPAPSLPGPISHCPFVAVTMRGDYAAGNQASRRILALSEARGYEPASSQARFLLAMLGCWFGPIEDGLQAAQRAREGLICGGDLANAAYTYNPTVFYLLDWAPSLDTVAAEVQAGLAFVRRTGNHQAGQWLEFYRWLAAVLRGDTSAAADDAVPADSYASNPLALLHGHLTRAIAGAVFGDLAGLARHTAATMKLLPIIRGFYPAAVVRVLRGLALAGQTRSSHGSERRALLAELNEVTQWVAARAEDAPRNFLHLLRLLEAERAWALGDFHAAALAFDTACRDAAQHQRPWHYALIAERSGRFFLAHGLDHAGYGLLAEARQEYAAWGATAKAGQLDWAYPSLRGHLDHSEAVPARGASEPGDVPHRRATLTTGTVDLLGILSASQALSSETSIERLHARVVEVLGAMTGATDVNLLLWNENRRGWLQPAPGRGIAAGGPGREHAVPMSVLRYVQRTGEPLVVGDATRDERFDRDPYFADLDCCSVLALPIQGRDTLRAVLVMENRLLRHAFNSDRLDVATLIAGQLAVSLDNAQLYTELSASRARIVSTADHARRRIERDLHDGAQQRLVSLALKARAAQARVPPEAGELAAQLDDLAGGLSSALDELRELARGVHPAILAAGGLRSALKPLARRSSVPVRLDVRVVGRLPESIEIAAYYVVSEALTNAAKHAHATVIDIDMAVNDDVLRIRVHDDGRGGARLDGGTGILGLRDRVETLGGRLRIQSPAGAGTTVEAELPHPTTDARVGDTATA